MPDITQDEAWIAGLLEGEGSFDLANKRTPRIRLIMTDLDIVIRAAAILGAHTVVRMKRTTSKWNVAYYLAVHGAPAIVWMNKLHDTMGERRRKRIRVCLDFWEGKKLWTGRRKQKPKAGPKLSSPNRVWTNPNSPLRVIQ